jgi:hypothetical protein
VGPGPRVRGRTAAFNGDEETRRFAPCVAVRLLLTRRPMHQLYDLGEPDPRVISWVHRCASRETFRGVSGREWGNLPLKRGSSLK